MAQGAGRQALDAERDVSGRLRLMIDALVEPRKGGAASTPRPLPAIVRAAIRPLLKMWSGFPKAPGYLYQVVEHWGPRLAVQPLECSLFNGMRMRCDLRDHIQRQIYFCGAYEPIETYLFELLLRPGMVVIDAGANVGQYSLVAAGAVGRHGEVHAFEPVTTTFQQLAAHVRENRLSGIVRPHMAALWHRAENLTLHLASDMMGNDGAYTIGIPGEVACTVTAVGLRLDDYVAERGLKRLHVVKLDVEGAELFALQGASRAVSRWRPTMFVEINRDASRRLGYEPDLIWQFLKPHGYLMWAVGQSAETCRSLSSLNGVDRANIVFHIGDLPDELIRGWTLKSVLRFHRRKRALSKHRGSAAVGRGTGPK